jgi:hypothetical protein
MRCDGASGSGAITAADCFQDALVIRDRDFQFIT